MFRLIVILFGVVFLLVGGPLSYSVFTKNINHPVQAIQPEPRPAQEQPAADAQPVVEEAQKADAPVPPRAMDDDPPTLLELSEELDMNIDLSYLPGYWAGVCGNIYLFYKKYQFEETSSYGTAGLGLLMLLWGMFLMGGRKWEDISD
jgi:hypothetical protein